MRADVKYQHWFEMLEVVLLYLQPVVTMYSLFFLHLPRAVPVTSAPFQIIQFSHFKSFVSYSISSFFIIHL